MLTIQPKFSTMQRPLSKDVSFRAKHDIDDDKEFFESKTNYYQEKVKDFDDVLNDKHTPNALKKIVKVFKVVSEAMLEGWAVAWGARKGSSVIKSSVVKGVNSKFAQKAAKLLKPLVAGAENIYSHVASVSAKAIEKLSSTKLAKNIGATFNGLVEKMATNSVGKYVVKGFEYIGKGLKFVGNLAKNGFSKLGKTIKQASGSEVYDKASRVTSTTLGAGAGVAGAYNAATGKDNEGHLVDGKESPNTDEFEDDIDRNMEALELEDED